MSKICIPRLLSGGLLLVLVGLIAGCAEDVIGQGETPAEPITQAECEAQSGFAFVEGGDFIRGSDRTERDYAYRITAEGFAKSPAEVAEAEAGYRRNGWFDREPPQQTQRLPAFCMSENLITNADYQLFVRATGHSEPGISATDYQTQGFLVHDYSEVEPK